MIAVISTAHADVAIELPKEISHAATSLAVSLQDNINESRLPPPLNLLQVVCPEKDRKLMAQFVMILVTVPTAAAATLVAWVLLAPMLIIQHLIRKSPGRTVGALCSLLFGSPLLVIWVALAWLHALGKAGLKLLAAYCSNTLGQRFERMEGVYDAADDDGCNWHADMNTIDELRREMETVEEGTDARSNKTWEQCIALAVQFHTGKMQGHHSDSGDAIETVAEDEDIVTDHDHDHDHNNDAGQGQETLDKVAADLATVRNIQANQMTKIFDALKSVQAELKIKA